MGTDTIAAIATAMTSSGIGIVRISGDEAVSITDRIFEMKNQKKLEDMPTHTIHYGHIPGTAIRRPKMLLVHGIIPRRSFLPLEPSTATA